MSAEGTAAVHKSDKLSVFRTLCRTCGKLIGESEALAPSSTPPEIYLQCLKCAEAEDRARLARRVEREVTCNKCGRVLTGFVDPSVQTIARCSKCDPPERQPREHETFCPEDRILRNGKRGAAAVTGEQSMGGQDYVHYDDWREARNEDAAVREGIYSPNSVEEAQKILRGLSIREAQKKWNIGCYESTREGKTRILRLEPGDLETPPPPPPRVIKHKQPRKCEHGMWKHRNDRKNSRYCSACYPNIHAHLIEWAIPLQRESVVSEESM